ncbi:MAG: FxsA family protein [Rhodospirillales bacterium]
MGLLLLGLFIAVPVLEIAVFIQVGGEIGLGWTLVIVVATAFAGSALLRYQGFKALARVRESLDAGHLPMADVFDGLCLLVAGCLLLTPGFVTDTAGFLLFVPGIRRTFADGIARYLVASGRVHMATGQSRAASNGPGGTAGRTDGPGPVIEGEFEDLSDKPVKDSPWNQNNGG